MGCHRVLRSVGAAVVALAALGVAQRSPAQATATLVASGLDTPLYATAPAGDLRLFAVERGGRIRVVKGGAVLATPFLDLSAKVSPTTGGEGGLLGMAFPPDYSESGLFYVYYTDAAFDSVVARFSVSGNPDVADPNEQVVLFVDQPAGATNHKGGTIQFGPDGFLWFATGDGGGGFDPAELAQNPQSLLGKMLRIDPGPVFAPGSLPVTGQLYRIPASNPFVGAPPRDEIWALGFRNPYRFSFDRFRGDLWIGDVGQDAWEEVDFEPAGDPGGHNYGWDVMEAGACQLVDPAPAPPCNDPSLSLPLYDYPHTTAACSGTVIGGYVYESDSSVLRGRYFFGDFCSGQIWSLDPDDVDDRIDHSAELAGPGLLMGFGEDGFGRVLIVRSSGSIHRIGPVSPPPPGCGIGPELVAVLGVLAGLRGRRLAARCRFGWAPSRLRAVLHRQAPQKRMENEPRGNPITDTYSSGGAPHEAPRSPRHPSAATGARTRHDVPSPRNDSPRHPA